MLTAIILAGGLGTRLESAVPHLPKSLAPIQQTPFLQILLNQLENAQILSKAILALGHKAPNIQEFLKNQYYSFSIETSIELSPLGTGGALLQALNKTDAETLLVLNGDSYFDLSLSNFLHFHRIKKADISIACKAMNDTSRYGSITIENSSQRILSFQEKSPSIKAGKINAGVYLIKRDLLISLNPGIYSLEKDFFPLFLKKNIFAYCHEGSFIDIGTPSSYNEAQKILQPWIPT